MNVLVIGGSGLFGRKIVIHLARDPEVQRVVCMDVAPPPAWVMKALGDHAAKFTYITGDVADLETVMAAVRGHGITRLVNMAFVLTGAFEQDPRRAVLVNTLGVSNVFEAARLANLERVVYASSVAVYGPQREYGDRAVNEDDHLHPGDPYGVTKQLVELLAARYADLYGVSAAGIRPFLGYGHGGAFPPIIKLFSGFVSLPAIGQPVSVPMDGTGPAALSSAEDVARLVTTLVKADTPPHPVYNIANAPTTMRQLAEAVKKYLPEARIEFGTEPPPDAKGAGLPGLADMSRAEADLGFRTLPLDRAVLAHINDARLDAGLPLITPEGDQS